MRTTELNYTNSRLIGLHSVVLTTYCMYSTVNRVCKPALRNKLRITSDKTSGPHQNSRQLYPIAPCRIVIPSTPPPTLISNPLLSAIRVKTFRFMAVVFSLSTALLVMIVRHGSGIICTCFRGTAIASTYTTAPRDGIVADAIPDLLRVSSQGSPALC